MKKRFLVVAVLTMAFAQLFSQNRILVRVPPNELSRVGVTGTELIPGWSLVTADTASMSRRLGDMGAYWELDRPVRLQFISSAEDSLARLQWWLTANNGTWNGSFVKAWEVATGSAKVKIGIIDSGIPKRSRWEHPDIDSARIVSSVSYVESTLPDDLDATDADLSSHGTHVLGAMIATSGNGIGIMGIDRAARVASYKAFTRDGFGWTSWTANATYRAAFDGCRVVNMSYGGPLYSRMEEDAILYAAGVKKMVCVVAAGNHSSEQPSFPAFFGKFSTRAGYREGFPTVITVGSIDRNGNLSPFSNRGWFVDIYAPGGWGGRYVPDPADTSGLGNKGFSFVDERNILSTIPPYPTKLSQVASDSTIPPGYGYLAGTSMAAPLVTATVALMFAANPNLPPERVRQILIATADSIPTIQGVIRVLNPEGAVRAARDHLTTFAFAEEGADGSPEFFLSPNYPNPFNPATTISFQLPKGGPVTLKVFDVLGREVAVLVNEERMAGMHTVHFNAAALPSGTYLYRLQANGTVFSRKMLLMK